MIYLPPTLASCAFVRFSCIIRHCGALNNLDHIVWSLGALGKSTDTFEQDLCCTYINTMEPREMGTGYFFQSHKSLLFNIHFDPSIVVTSSADFRLLVLNMLLNIKPKRWQHHGLAISPYLSYLSQCSNLPKDMGPIILLFRLFLLEWVCLSSKSLNWPLFYTRVPQINKEWHFWIWPRMQASSISETIKMIAVTSLYDSAPAAAITTIRYQRSDPISIKQDYNQCVCF